MKKILLLSDTHGHIDQMMLQYIHSVDEVWHAGDIGTTEVTDTIKKHKVLRAVYGNIDGAELRKEFKEVAMFTVEAVKVLMMHIGGYPGHYTPKARSIMQQYPPDLFISGHSHILKVMYDKKHRLLHLNPGAAGNKGFHKVRTMLRFVIDNGKIKNMEVIEVAR